MSLTKRRPEPGSSTSTMGRAGAPSMSGMTANSSRPTTIAPSDTGIGSGNGSFVT